MKSILLALVFALAVIAVSAHEYKAGSLEIKHPWARATPKGATVAGGYMKIINTGTAPDRLVGGSTVAAGEFGNFTDDDGRRRNEDAGAAEGHRDQARRDVDSSPAHTI